MSSTIKISGRTIGQNNPVYIIAEISANHQQMYQSAVELVRAAKAAGADAVKLQTYTAETLTINSNKPAFKIEGNTLWDGRTLFDLYDEAHMPWDWQPKLNALAHELEIDLFSSPFDPSSVSFLEKMQTPAYKIASFEIVDLPLIRRVAQTGKPIIMSTGMASLEEIAEAVGTAQESGALEIALLKCTSCYPADPADMNLATIPDLIQRFGLPVGLSDHTLSATVPITAVALGARILEKHITLSRGISGPDSAFSLEPDEFRNMVLAVREAERAIGGVYYGPMPHEERSLTFRRSLFVVEDVNRGESITEKNLRSIRPSNGLHTRHLRDLIGRTASCNITRGTPMSWDLVEPEVRLDETQD